MVKYDCTENQNYVPIPRSWPKSDSSKFAFNDRNRKCKLPMESAKPLFGKGASSNKNNKSEE